ncbi:putative DNA mismatch repair protein MutS domain protein [groundwater metagenome]|uniref:Putative DNA mismatch repair protein MutS domain protein n=1 Tax=groundwater metagenome TaxID=717931 RepID=A0A098E9K6_9ZZZZ
MSVLKTSDAKAAYKEVSEIIKKHIITKKGREKFSLDLFSDAKDISAMQEKISKYIRIDNVIIDKIRENLTDFELKKAGDFFVDRVVIVPDDESYERFMWLKKYCDVRIGNSNEDIDERQQIVMANPDMPVEEILPEFFIINFASNKETIKKIYEIYSLLQQQGIEVHNTANTGIEKLKEISDIVASINEKCEITTEEISRKKRTIKNFKGIIYEYKEKINFEIPKEVEKRAIRIDAKELLMKNIDSISQIPEISEIIKTITEKYIGKISENFFINKTLMFSIFEKNYPVTVDEGEIEKFLNETNREILEAEYEYKVKSANKLIKFELIEQLCEEIYSLDEILGIVKFANDNKAVMPKISDALFFKGAKNLLLNNSTAITYSLGGEIERRKISMLTGANSGGKTTLLKTILHIQILAQSGLPVCAESCEFPVFDEIYFLSKHTGTLSAGAFESTLKAIAKILISKSKKLVLMDELEAITEPGAAAKMISAIFEILIENDDFAVIVTHLSDEILKHVGKDVRVDGIEATGLDEQLNLIVDRQPKFNKIGKSTPELIVERLYRLSMADNKGTEKGEKEIYRRIFEKMKKQI